MEILYFVCLVGWFGLVWSVLVQIPYHYSFHTCTVKNKCLCVICSFRLLQVLSRLEPKLCISVKGGEKCAYCIEICSKLPKVSPELTRHLELIFFFSQWSYLMVIISETEKIWVFFTLRKGFYLCTYHSFSHHVMPLVILFKCYITLPDFLFTIIASRRQLTSLLRNCWI